MDRGHVVRGAAGHVAEVGLSPIAPTDRHSCGVDGAWEAYCSGRGIAGFVRERLEEDDRESTLRTTEELTAKDVLAAERAEDPVANEYVDRISRYNAAGFGTIVNAYNPDMITVGGGVGHSNFETLRERMVPHLERFALPAIPPIEPAGLGDEIGLYGALAPFADGIDVGTAASTVAASTDD